SVAVTSDDERLSLVVGDQSRTHGERVPSEISQALQDAGLARSAIDLIAVAAGPGAFTGLRIGLATAQGLALTLDRPVVGVSALDALAWTVSHNRGRADSEFVGAWMDAQRGDVFAALYRLMRSSNPDVSPPRESVMVEAVPSRWTVVEAPVTARPQTVLEAWTAHLADRDAVFIGDAAQRDHALIAQIGRGRWRAETPDALAPAIAGIGRRLALDGLPGKPHLLKPIYVRRPDAEIERERRRPS